MFFHLLSQAGQSLQPLFHILFRNIGKAEAQAIIFVDTEKTSGADQDVV